MIDRSRPVLALSGPVLLFGGPYSNLHALDALLMEAERRGVPASNIVSTGDLVAYCADARGVVDRVQAAGVRFIRGNCEDQLAAGAEDCGCGFAPGGECDRLAATWFAHALRELDEEHRAFLGGAPAQLDLTLNGLRISVIHGSATQTNRFVFASTPDRIKAHDLDLLGADVVVAGHCGLPFTQTIGDRLWHNPGALGMPANDGLPRVWFSVLSPGAAPRTLEIEHCALDYDAAGAADAMARADLPLDYAHALRTGLWPNCDCLPPMEARRQGRALQPARLAFICGAPVEWPVEQAACDARGDEAEAVPSRVALAALKTLWINTGTLCNLACARCYIESSPRNDALAYISAGEAGAYFDEIADRDVTIGFTGGEPFLNRDLLAMMENALGRGFRALVLTNAMKPMRRCAEKLLALQARFGERLALRVSVDHYSRDLHELERGARSFEPTLQGLAFLVRNGFAVSVAGRLYSGEPEPIVRGGYATLFAERGLKLDAYSPDDLVLFPEMDAAADAPVITEACWSLLDKSKQDVMCASQRMVVKRKGAERPVVVACTLLPYAAEFELGPTLASARAEVTLSHPHCATFCILGGATCSG
jgi:predicted phosphodiesterase